MSVKLTDTLLDVANGGTGATTLTDNGVLIGNGTGAVDVTAAGATGEVLVGVTGGNPVWGAWLPQGAVKTAPETVTSSTSLQSDDHLSCTIGTSGTWVINLNLAVTANASGGFKYDFTLPAGATGYMVATGNTTLGTTGVSATAGAGGTAAITVGIGFLIKLYVVSGGTAGTVQFRWAQNASFGTGTSLGQGSNLTSIRIS